MPLSLEDLVDLLGRGALPFPVMGGDQVLGLVTLTDIKKVPRDQWEAMTVYRAMTPAAQLVAVRPDTPLEQVLRLLSERDLNQVAVMERGELRGFVTRAGVMQALQDRVELGAVEDEPRAAA